MYRPKDTLEYLLFQLGTQDFLGLNLTQVAGPFY